MDEIDFTDVLSTIVLTQTTLCKNDFIGDENFMANKTLNKKNFFIFNPCLEQYKDNIFICAFRVFTRCITQNPNDPWILGNSKSQNDEIVSSFWNSNNVSIRSNGSDLTILCLLQIDAIPNGYNIEQVRGSNIFISKEGVVDTRLFKNGDSFIASYNIGVWGDGNFRQNIEISKVIITENNSIELHTSMKPCFDINEQRTTEKNWSFFKHLGSIYIAQHIDPFTIYKLENNNTCVVYYKYDIFKPYKQVFLTYLDIFNTLHISLTTPIKKFEDKYYGIGHLKFQLNKSKLLNAINSDIYNIDINKKKILDFCTVKSSNKHRRKHPTYIYLMFLFGFSFTNGQIDKVEMSNPFYFNNNKTNISFPMGLNFNAVQMLMSYGEGDDACKLVIADFKDFKRDVGMIHPFSGRYSITVL